jgi:ribosomal protein L11
LVPNKPSAVDNNPSDADSNPFPVPIKPPVLANKPFEVVMKTPPGRLILSESRDKPRVARHNPAQVLSIAS